jgi:anti-anti-sigma factor
MNALLVDDPAVVEVEGPLRTPINPDLRLEVHALLRRGESNILLNLAGISELDAAGVGELAHLYRLATAAGGTLRVVNAFGNVREVLARVGLLDLLAAEQEDDGDL